MLAARLLGTRNEGGPVISYLLIESRDPFESNDVPYYYELAKALREAGNEVTLFLVQNGVLAARPSAPAAALSALGQSGVKVLVVEFSLRHRGLAWLPARLASAPPDVMVAQREGVTGAARHK